MNKEDLDDMLRWAFLHGMMHYPVLDVIKLYKEDMQDYANDMEADEAILLASFY